MVYKHGLKYRSRPSAGIFLLWCAMSPVGTFETSRPALTMSAYRGRPEVVGRRANMTRLTLNGLGSPHLARLLPFPIRCPAARCYALCIAWGRDMHRRGFIRLLGGVAAACPIIARAQQPMPIRRIGVLMAIRDSDPLRQSYVDALDHGLRAAGWIDGKNIQLDFRWAGADVGRIKQAAKEVMAGSPNLVIAHTSPATIALKSETSTTPILFVTVTEPLAQGLVKSLAKPGGNVTGFSNFEFSMGGKWLQILKEILPDLKRANVLFNPDTAPGAGQIFLRSIEAAAKLTPSRSVRLPSTTSRISRTPSLPSVIRKGRALSSHPISS